MTGVKSPVRTLTGDWGPTFSSMVASAENRLLLCAPFITRQGAAHVQTARLSRPDIGPRSLVLTDLCPRAVCAGATDPNAVATIQAAVNGARVIHLPRLHAKVYVADGRRAIVTSGNLTIGGLARNHEYGIAIENPVLAASIESDIVEFAALGAEIDPDTLARYCDAAAEARAAYEQQVASASRQVQRTLAAALEAADETLLRARLAGGAVHTVFARTILYLLRHRGSLSTEQQHPLIQQLHPDLCDDTVDRVIDGKHFGKKWKHAVRTAHQQLKRGGQIELADGGWRLVGTTV